MAYGLFIGRTIIISKPQQDCFEQYMGMDVKDVPRIGAGCPQGHLDTLVTVITSANQAHSRYNPIDGADRMVVADRFGQHLAQVCGIDYEIIRAPEFATTDRYADFLLEEIRLESEGRLNLNPGNTVVFNSTEPVYRQFLERGFSVNTMEFDPKARAYIRPTPTVILERFAALGTAWERSPEFKGLLASSTLGAWRSNRRLPSTILRLFRDPILNDQGEITATRNHEVYELSMSNPEAMRFKFDDVVQSVASANRGPIVDVGCADGAFLVLAAKAFPDEMFYGVELTKKFTEHCARRLAEKQFGGAYVKFFQRNALEQVFEPGSLGTKFSNSAYHEYASFIDWVAALPRFFKISYDELRALGRSIGRDVVGPRDKHMEVALRLNAENGSNDDVYREFDLGTEQGLAGLASHLEGLSTYSRFLRFARDFRAHERAAGIDSDKTRVQYHVREMKGQMYALMERQHAAEFLQKMMYTDSWASENHEILCGRSLEDYEELLRMAGFDVVKDAEHPERGTREFLNEYKRKHFYEGRVALCRPTHDGFEPMPFDPDNMVLVGQKPGR
jgi:hypothetical protein